MDRLLASSLFSQVRFLIIFYLIFLFAGWLFAVVQKVEFLGTEKCDPFWWAFVHTMDPGFLGGEADPEKLALRPLGIFLTLVGFFVLGGLLISVLVNAYERRVRQAREGLTRYSFKEDHGIILGWDRMGPATVRQLLSDGCQEVVILSLKSAEDIRSRLKAVSASWEKEVKRRFEQIYILHGSFDSEEELQRLRPWSARKVVILGDAEMRGSNSRNLQTAMRIAGMLQDDSVEAQERLDCQVAISHFRTYDLLQEIDLSPEDRTRLNFRPFNFYEGWARKVWSRLPEPGNSHEPYSSLFYQSKQNSENASVAVAIIGFGQMGQAMAIQAARLANHANNQEAEIMVTDPDMSSIKNRFLSQYGLVDERLPGVKFSFHEAESEGPEIRSLLTELAVDEKKILTVVICLSDPDQSMATALGLPPEVLICDIPILVRQETTSGLSEFAERLREQAAVQVVTWQNDQQVKANDTRWDNVRFFGSLDEYLLDDSLQEKLAEEIHEKYREMLKDKGWDDSEKPAQQAWKNLGEKYRWSNRYQADAYLELLNAHGFKLVPGSDPDAKACVENFDEDVLENMARQEHNRWWVERVLAGWTKGQRDDLRLTHPNMVPFEELEEETKEYDREAIRRAPELLKKTCKLFIVKR